MVALVVSFVLDVSGASLAATTINLGAAGNFAVLGSSTITNIGSTVVNGDLGLNPGASVTGFPPGVVNGTQHITDGVAAQAQIDLVTAYNLASTQAGAVIISGDLGGLTLTPGVYNSATSIGLTGGLTLDGQGNQNAVFIFQIGSTLTTASGSTINLINGAQACNVFWQVGSSATLGTNSSFSGTILAFASVTATTGASINGRVLARNGAVTLDTSPITRPVCIVATPTPTSSSTPIPTVSPTITPTPTPSPTPTASPTVTPAPTVTPTPTPKLPNTGFGPN
ncbi:MAG: hypothetical protein UW46_C0006G0039 [Candidatus Yanofskybacteria bacterium GW2011_GWF1_44_227]|uniref:DUF3494 domain-containing protein n=1 Tax=Candidatus Yanofskybacteria bacterium GW2011_GWE2_40_11 TaxID=1619033 RepID=A0A0G0QT02_9BACT|nr:MAG: hypothetical protein UT69_C0002G0034 [Candidatus Yanofskybacteria bacterium GW2011_GWE1_40_10]KKR40486.1 MAG: hypothetical protein UT75_C0008G0008 [Candidatus Yanofskybacteria bacterium GW2011_GWE2_40_11]KKT15446.1 MAG: hypothetical protein UV97_C0006G0013 [Candidatus Yanofskybacteria bacterium GW2011_GWF2_43_596]KKT53138.1 MAG: hypothetical protein UW46_C0006G0039 [Candidatus Yanofskybacteria bacterium GW2011_GWF1_44_227]